MAITSICNPYEFVIPSSWHGTHVAGTIAAVNDNSVGVAGIAPGAKVLGVRVLGSCGGLVSDIADGIAWASGGSVPGVPANGNPAKVINLSLGGGGSCGSATQEAITKAINNGATVVVAAGNWNDDVAYYSPASCSGVITVAAVNRYGDRAYYSNHDSASSTGSFITLAAPGGDTYTDTETDGVLSTLNTGTKSASTYTYAWYQGTSMATPHISGIVALMLASNPNLTDGSITPSSVPGIIKSRLQSTARAFPGGSTCTTLNCGAGIVDAAAAVASVGTAPVVTANADQLLVLPSTVVNLTGTATDNNGAPTHQWDQTAGTGVTLGDSGALDTSFTAPAGDDTLTFRLTASDDLLLSASASVTVRVRTVPAAPSGLTATAATNGHIDLAWSDNSGNEEEFRIYRDDGTGAVHYATVTANALTYSDAEVTVDATYTYHVIAYNGFTSDPSATASATAIQPRSSGGGGAIEWLSLLIGAGLLGRRRAAK